MASSSAIAIGYLVDALRTRPRTIDELVEVTGIHRLTIGTWIRTWHTMKRKVVRIGGWELKENGRIKVAMWELGDGPDVPRPPKLSRTRQVSRYRESHPKRVQAQQNRRRHRQRMESFDSAIQKVLNG